MNDKDFMNEINKVYLVQHVHQIEDKEDVKIIGIFISLREAEAAINRLKKAPGFAISSDGFYIDEYALNKVFWSEGFEAE